MDVARELSAVGKNGVAADRAIVRQVYVSHDPVVIAKPGNARVLRRTRVERTKLPYGVAVPDLERRGFAGVLLVLRNLAQYDVVRDAVSGADTGMSGNHRVCADTGVRADHDMWADDGEWPDFDIRRELRVLVDDRGRMDH